MVISTEISLFAPHHDGVLESSSNWVSALFSGEVALIVSMLGVALLGFSMLSGALRLHKGGKVVLGISVCLGAHIIANVMLAGVSQSAPSIPNAIHAEPKTERETLMPTTVDPFSGA